MKTHLARLSFALLFLLPAPPGQGAALTVPGTATPYLAGLPNGTQSSMDAPQPPDAAPAQSPAIVQGIPLPLPPKCALSFVASGGVLHHPVPGYAFHSPDGATAFSLDLGPIVPHRSGTEHGISDVKAPIDSLVGVFLGAEAPNTTPAPPPLDFSTAVSRDYLLLRPLLKQVFFVGDGLTSGGVGQLVVPPPGATRLYLATMDNYGWSNNLGAFLVSVTVSNLPTTLTIYSPTLSIGTGGRVTFSAAGGTPPYVFSLIANNSGGGITPSGEYYAGNSGGSDVVRVTDSSDAIAEATIAIVPVPKYVNIGRNPVGTVTSNAPGFFTIVGGGMDIWDNIDEFTFSHEEVTGDFDVRVRVESLSPNARWSKAGIMVRESVAEDSRMAFIRVTPGPGSTCATNTGDGANDIRFGYRTGHHEPAGVQGDDHNGGRHEDFDAANPVLAPPYPNAWLRLVRAGSTFTSYSSSNGVNWHVVASQNTAAWNGGALKPTALVGLAVSALSATAPCGSATAEFRNYDLRLGSTGTFRVAGADSRGNPNGVRVEFSKPVTFSGATFSLSGGAVVGNAAAGPNPSTVQLNTSGLTEGVVYTLTVSGATSTDGESMTANTATFRHGAGYELRRIHLSRNMIPGPFVDLYRNSTAYRLSLPVACQGRPATEGNVLFEELVPNAVGNENFSTRINGVLNISAAGNYRFACATDDQGILFLSTDENPANKAQIAREPEWSEARAFSSCVRRTCLGGVPQENQKTVYLDPGRYYLELIASDSVGFNGAAVTWDSGTGVPIADGQSPIVDTQFVPSRFFSGEVFYALGPTTITRQPQSVSVAALQSATFTIGADGTPPYSFQWFRNGLPVPGATARTYAISGVHESDAGNYTVVLANEFSSVTSSVAVLTVTAPLAIVPSWTNVASSTTIALGATGGTPPYTFATVALNSGGSFDPVTRVYTAGPNCGTDTIQVTDSSLVVAQAMITVRESVPPMITACPMNRSLAVGSNCQAAVPSLVSEVAASDACSAVTVTQNPSPGTLVGLGTHTLTFTAMDASGNAATCTATLTVNDTTPPAITCPANVTVNSALLSVSVPFSVMVTDQCDAAATIVCTPASGSLFNQGTTAVNCTATDAAGNSGTCAFTVTLASVLPLQVLPATMNVSTGAAINFTASGGAAPYAFDFVSNNSGGSITVGGSYTAGPAPLVDVVRVTDALGGAATATIQIHVVVPGTATPYLAGLPDGTESSPGAPEPPDVAPRQSPVRIGGLSFQPGLALSFRANGGVLHYSPGPGAILDPPDGRAGTAVTHRNGAEHGLSDVRAPLDALVGVFLGAEAPEDSPAPVQLNFSTPELLDYALLQPQLKQVFFIGDGLRADGSSQWVAPPTGATRLYLATVDTYGWANNHGRFSISLNLTNLVQPFTLSPDAVEVFPHATTIFSASGGVPPYTFALVTNNSGGSILSNGVYAAGSTQGVDVVRVADLNGSNAMATVKVLIVAPVVEARASAASTLVFTWPSGASAFVVESTESLEEPILWQEVTNGITANAVTVSLTVTNTQAQGRYYRLRRAAALDTDLDGLPDHVEAALGLSPRHVSTLNDGIWDGNRDSDGDGLRNQWEYLHGLNPDSPDSDGDGIPDGAEDRDRDGLTEAEEQTRGTNPLRADSDGDGWPDAVEIEAGGDPLSASMRPRATFIAMPPLKVTAPALGSMDGLPLNSLIATPPVSVTFDQQ